MSPLDDALPGTVAILGLGVMGGSLARALAEAAPETRVVGWTPSVGERSEAMDAGVVEAVPSAWEEAVDEADAVVLAMPLEACLQVLPELAGLTGPETTLTDVASLKAPLARTAAQVGLTERWVGSHPMAGSETSGFRHGRADLFRGARVWLTEGDADDRHVRMVRALWRAVGAEPRSVDAEVHDREMAWASHLPQLVSNALGAELARQGVSSELLGPGGRDMTRLAASRAEMWLDLFRYAHADLPRGLRGVAGTLIEAAEALEAGHTDSLEALMRASRTWKETS